MTISLCICTYRRPAELRRCLDGIARGVIPDEVIVSDDGHQPEVEDIVSTFPWVRYQRGPARGLGANRNSCIAAAGGDHLAFIDDDVVVPANFIATAYDIAGDDPITGYEIRYDPHPRRVTPCNSDYLGFQTRRPTRVLNAIVINATVFPRHLFERALFDENLRYGCDEIDIARHATALGYRIRFCERLYVDHFPSPVNRSDNRKQVHISRIYAKTKAHWRYDSSPARALTYFTFAATHYCCSRLLRRPRDVPRAIADVREAARRIRKIDGQLSATETL